MRIIKHFITNLSLPDWFVIMTVVAAVGTIIWAYLTDWLDSDLAFLTPLIVIGVLVVGLLGAERISAWRARRPFKPLPDDGLREMIQNWLVAHGYIIEIHPLNDGMSISMVVNSEAGNPVHIQKSDDGSGLELSATYRFSEDYRVLFDAMATSQPTMFEEMQIELLHFELPYSGLGHPLREVVISDRIVYDETFTRVRLLDKVVHIMAAYAMLSAIVIREAKKAFPEEAAAAYASSPASQDATPTPTPPKSGEEREQSP